jgi:6-phosphogluconolactonase
MASAKIWTAHAVLALALLAGAQALAATHRAYIGTARVAATATAPAGGGEIFLVDIDSETGALGHLRLVAKTPASVGWMVLDPVRNVLYAADEGGMGSVSAYAVARDTGALTLLGSQPTKGSPVYLSLHPSGKYLFAANYGGGSLPVFPIRENGSLGEMSDIFVSPPDAPIPPGSPSAGRPPRIHYVTTDPTGKYVVANEAGRNKIFAFTLDRAAGKLIPAPAPFVSAEPADGPRHGAFSPDGRTFYNLSEFDATLTVYDFDPATGALAQRQRVATVPADYRGFNATGELLISRDGRYLYVTNRGHDTIASFRVGRDGKVAFIGDTPSQSQSPRSIAFDPAGRFLISVTELGGAVAAFRIHLRSGLAIYAGQAIAMRQPRSIAFLP